jgi:2-aminophenol/2-amino-5-chlorophenol 1,6-dioxygenase subunit alpha
MGFNQGGRAVSVSSVKAAYIVPGLPHLAFGNGRWQPLKDAYAKAGENAQSKKADVLVIYSGQWISVLGHSFQTDPNPKGLHVDDNWYDLGEFPFSFKVDVELAHAAADLAQTHGLATKLVNYEGFPIDTGTLVALKYFNPENKLPVMIVSSNIYAGQEDSVKLGQAVGEAIKRTGRNAILINCSALSYRFSTQEVDSKSDRISSKEDDEWNLRMLDLLKQGKNSEAFEIGPEYAKAAAPEAMFKGFYWMMGALNTPAEKANVLGYGPVWGTGAAVVEYNFDGR